jgi:hypothetical protein
LAPPTARRWSAPIGWSILNVSAFEILEAHGLHVILVNARYAKNVPGRKTDVSDAGWLRQLHSYGLLRGSFRPEAEIATLRAYSLRCREGSLPEPSPPPLAYRKPEMRSLKGPFFFLFQRVLARPSDFRRLAFRPKSVSEAPASLSIRPSPRSRRIQKVYYFQYVDEIKLRRS